MMKVFPLACNVRMAGIPLFLHPLHQQRIQHFSVWEAVRGSWGGSKSRSFSPRRRNAHLPFDPGS
jgi:hypothetical protein